MKATPFNIKHLGSTTVSAAGITVASLLSAFAMLATPVLSESATLYSFSIAEHSAAFFRWGPWPIAGAASSAVVLLALNVWRTESPRLKLAAGSTCFAIILIFSVFYVYSVLVAPQLELQQFMHALNHAANPGAGA